MLPGMSTASGPAPCHLLLLDFGGFLLFGSGGDLGVQVYQCLMMLGLLVLDEYELDVERMTVIEMWRKQNSTTSLQVH